MIYESMTSVSLNHNDVIQEIGGVIMERLNSGHRHLVDRRARSGRNGQRPVWLLLTSYQSLDCHVVRSSTRPRQIFDSSRIQ
jgi:hypothetical protein